VADTPIEYQRMWALIIDAINHDDNNDLPMYQQRIIEEYNHIHNIIQQHRQDLDVNNDSNN
jgi:hypothetical protein